MNRRPTPKAGIVAAVGGLLLAVGSTAQAGWLFVLSAGVLGLVASGMLTRHRLAAATLTRTLPQRARAGDEVVMMLSLHNASAKRLPVMRVEDSFPAFEGVAIACESLPPGATSSVELTPVALRRGVFGWGDVTLGTAAPFGLMRTRRTTAVSSRLIVHPATRQVPGFALPETPATTADEALAVTRTGGGEVFAGVRDYRPGDQRRYIHWRTTARTGRLAVREHEEPARSPVVLVVAGLGDGDDAEQLVSDAASIGLHALANGRPVHCVGRGRFGEHVEDATRADLLDWAAALEPSDSTPEDAVADAFRKWGRRCSFVLFENDEGFTHAAAELARRRGAGVEVVLSASPEDDEAAP
ncbi:MAG: DUF58 domain-containing protein [Actinomycetota bacterium]|nr:DUF58 domain-containing protein [Actinomycetota bacterium]